MNRTQCPVCQKGLSPGEALKSKCICPHCQTPLKWKSSKILLALTFIMGMVLGVLVDGGLWIYAAIDFILIVALFVVSVLTGRFETVP